MYKVVALSHDVYDSNKCYFLYICLSFIHFLIQNTISTIIIIVTLYGIHKLIVNALRWLNISLIIQANSATAYTCTFYVYDDKTREDFSTSMKISLLLWLTTIHTNKQIKKTQKHTDKS